MLSVSLRRNAPHHTQSVILATTLSFAHTHSTVCVSRFRDRSIDPQRGSIRYKHLLLISTPPPPTPTRCDVSNQMTLDHTHILQVHCPAHFHADFHDKFSLRCRGAQRTAVSVRREYLAVHARGAGSHSSVRQLKTYPYIVVTLIVFVFITCLCAAIPESISPIQIRTVCTRHHFSYHRLLYLEDVRV